MGKDLYRDKVTFEKRYCKICCSEEIHRVLTRWGVSPRIRQKKNRSEEAWIFEGEVVSYCGKCVPHAVPENLPPLGPSQF